MRSYSSFLALEHAQSHAPRHVQLIVRGLAVQNAVVTAVIRAVSRWRTALYVYPRLSQLPSQP